MTERDRLRAMGDIFYATRMAYHGKDAAAQSFWNKLRNL
jgi:hypothetical protein